MANKLPPLPVGVAPGSGYWNDWYEKLRVLVNNVASGLAHNLLTGIQGGSSGEYYHLTSANASLVPTSEQTSNKDSSNGYAGLNSVSRVVQGIDTSDDIITDSTTKGPVMKSPNGHYWRATISNLGVVTWTDLGTTKP